MLAILRKLELCLTLQRNTASSQLTLFFHQITAVWPIVCVFPAAIELSSGIASACLVAASVAINTSQH